MDDIRANIQTNTIPEVMLLVVGEVEVEVMVVYSVLVEDVSVALVDVVEDGMFRFGWVALGCCTVDRPVDSSDLDSSAEMAGE